LKPQRGAADDQNMEEVFAALKELMTPPDPPRKGCRPYESRPTVRLLDTAKAGRSGLASGNLVSTHQDFRAPMFLPGSFSTPWIRHNSTISEMPDAMS
jgi:hypothetical protein